MNGVSDNYAKTEKQRRSSCPSVPFDNNPAIKRSTLTQAQFDELYLKTEKEDCVSLKDRVSTNVYCDRKRIWKLLSSYLPIIKYIRYYRPKELALADIFAGLTVGILHIPQALAFGSLTSVKFENGLFTSVWPVLIYVFFGTSAHVSMGTSAVICILTAATVDRLGEDWASNKPWLNSELKKDKDINLDDIPAFLDYKEEIAMGVALLTGLIMIVLGLLKLGFITYYLSESFFAAFTSAAAVHIGTSQVPAMLGLKVSRFSGVFKIIHTYEEIFSVINRVNIASIVFAVSTCLIVQLVKDCINERFKQKLPAPIPIELFIVIFATVISHFGDFANTFNLDIVGPFPNNIPPPRLPMQALKESPKFVVDAFILAILIFANTIAMAKICAKKHNYEVDDSQELIAYGMCNALSSFFLCFPSSVAPPRSMVASNMNARTTLNGLFSASVMIMVILFVGPLFMALPKAALAAIIFISLKGLFVQILDGRKFWKINKFDFVIWLSTFLSTVFLDIDVGLGVGVAVSLITVVFQTQFARGFRICRLKKQNVLVEEKRYNDTIEIAGIKIFRFQSNIYFANAEIFRKSLYSQTLNPRKLLKYLKKRQQKYEKLCKENEVKGLKPLTRKDSVLTGENLLVNRKTPVLELSTNDSESSLTKKVSAVHLSERKRKISASSLDHPSFTIEENGDVFIATNIGTASLFDQQQPHRSSTVGNVNLGYSFYSGQFSREDSLIRLPSVDSTANISTDDVALDEYGEEIVSDDKLKKMRGVHHIIIDFTPVNYIDSSGSNVICHIVSEYAHVNVQVYLTGVSADVRRAMTAADAFSKIRNENIFVDLTDAIIVAMSKNVEALSKTQLQDFSDAEAIEDSYITKM